MTPETDNAIRAALPTLHRGNTAGHAQEAKA